jgi:hypothetical protein
MTRRFDAAMLRIELKNALINRSSLVDMLQKTEAREKQEKERDMGENEEKRKIAGGRSSFGRKRTRQEECEKRSKCSKQK